MDRQVLVAVHVDTSVADSAAALRERVTALEAAGAHLLTFAPGADGDGLSPVEAASFAAAWTDRVGLVPVVDPVHAEPFHVSNQLSSLDRISRGRAGWWVDVVDDDARARAYGTDPVATQGPTALAQEVAEVVEVVRRLWDSWADGALVADEETGRFLDADLVRHVDFVGRRFSVKGPALLPRPPQGHVPVLADASWLDATAADVTVLGTGPAAAERAAIPGGAAVGHSWEREARESTAEGPSVVDVAVASGSEPVETIVARVVAQAAEVARRAPGAPIVVRLVPAGPTEARDVVGHVLPALRTAGLLVATPAPGRTLRDLLGLDRPDAPDRRPGRQPEVDAGAAAPGDPGGKTGRETSEIGARR